MRDDLRSGTRFEPEDDDEQREEAVRHELGDDADHGDLPSATTNVYSCRSGRINRFKSPTHSRTRVLGAGVIRRRQALSTGLDRKREDIADDKHPADYSGPKE